MNYNTINFFNDIKFLLRNIATFKENATFKLLFVSIFVSISGIFRFCIASILLNVNLNLIMGLAAGLITYSVYTLDRLSDEKFQGSNTKICFMVSLISYIVGIYIFTINGLLFFALLPAVVGFLYTKEFKIGKRFFKLKGPYGGKNLIVGSTWGLFIAGAAGFTNIISFLVVFVLYTSKSFINSTVNDFKDIKEDSLLGLNTLPVSLGERKTRDLLLCILVFSNLLLYISMINKIISFNYIILSCSFFFGLFGIFYKNTLNWVSKGIRDGESLITILLVLIANTLFSTLNAFSL